MTLFFMISKNKDDITFIFHSQIDFAKMKNNNDKNEHIIKLKIAKKMKIMRKIEKKQKRQIKTNKFQNF